VGSLAAALLFLLRGREDEGVEAAEGTLKRLTSPLEGFKAGEGLGLAPVKEGVTTVLGGGDSQSLSVLGVRAVDVGAMTYGEKTAYFMESEGLGEDEARKAAYDPSQFERVTGAGFEWTKAGRYQYKQSLKEQARKAKAERAGFSSVTEWLSSKEKAAAGERSFAESMITALTSVGPGVESGYVAEGTHVWTEEELSEVQGSWIWKAFQKQAFDLGLVPKPDEIPSGADTEHLLSIIDWEKTALMGDAPYG